MQSHICRGSLRRCGFFIGGALNQASLEKQTIIALAYEEAKAENPQLNMKEFAESQGISVGTLERYRTAYRRRHIALHPASKLQAEIIYLRDLIRNLEKEYGDYMRHLRRRRREWKKLPKEKKEKRHWPMVTPVYIGLLKRIEENRLKLWELEGLYQQKINFEIMGELQLSNVIITAYAQRKAAVHTQN